MNYRSVADLNESLLKWLPRLPRDLEAIVGIPRSGMLAANLLALHLNLPLADLEGFAAGRLLQSGDRCPVANREIFLRQPRSVLLLDDSLLLGNQMARARSIVDGLPVRHRIRFGAVYIQPGMEHLVDFFCEPLPRPRVFEWHLMHHGNLRHWCVDIDGVLCPDPTEEENDDGVKYRHFLKSVCPNVVPSKEIGWLVTCRLEKYREATEEWLHRQGVRFRNLIMMDFSDMQARRAAGNHAAFKADIYSSTGAQLFIESSLRQAVEIAALTGKSVFCFETREMLQPDLQPQTVPQSGAAPHSRGEVWRTLQGLFKS